MESLIHIGDFIGECDSIHIVISMKSLIHIGDFNGSSLWPKGIGVNLCKKRLRV